MSIASRIAKNALAAAGQKGARLIEQFLAVPFFISAWGVEKYGEWLVITAIPSLLAMADAGIGTAASTKFQTDYFAGKTNRAADTYRSGFLLISLISICFIGAVAVTLTVFSEFFFNSFRSIDAISAALICGVLLFARGFAFQQHLFEGVINARGKAYINLNLSAISTASTALLTVVALMRGADPVTIAISIAGMQVLTVGIHAAIAHKNYHSLSLPAGRFDSVLSRGLMVSGGGYFLLPVWQIVYFQGTSLAVHAVLGPAMVVVFNTARTLSRSISQIFSLIISASLPELIKAVGSHDFVVGRRVFRAMMGATLFSALIGCIALMTIGESFYAYWTQKALVVPHDVWLIFVAAVLLHAAWWPASFVFQAFNRPYAFSLAAIAAAVISVCVCYAAGLAFGLRGATAGALLFELAMAIYVLPLAASLLGQPLAQIPKQFLWDFWRKRSNEPL